MESIAEDMYLCCVARLYGYPVQVTKSSGYRHWQGMSFSGKRTEENRLVSTYKRRALSERNKTITMLLTCPSFFLISVFPIHMIFITFEGTIVSMFTANINLFHRVYLTLPLSIWKHCRIVGKLRRKIQHNSVIGSKKFLSTFKWFPWKLKLLFRFGIPSIN
jgi:hypothetical protein